MFWNKKENWLVLSEQDGCFKLVQQSKMNDEDKFCGVVFMSKDYEQADNVCRILSTIQNKLDIKLDIIKLLLSKEISKLDLSNKLAIKEGNLTIDGTCYFTSSIIEKNANILYAVQGSFPNIVVSKYEKVAEDTFNYCLRQEEGNLTLLPKTNCFDSKEDAVEYQNQLIQKEISKLGKKK